MIRFGRVGAIVVLLVLAFFAAWSWAGRRTPVSDTAIAADAVGVTAEVRVEAATSVVASDPTVSVVNSTVTSLTVERSDGIEATVEAALHGWGQFGADRDLGWVRDWFVANGPQMARFEIEASETSPGGTAYAVVWEDREVEWAGDEARARGVVRFIRGGEPTQRFEWEFHLQRSDQRWLVWTVVDTED